MTEEYRGYSIETLTPYNMKHIRPIGKGSVHLDLRGSFTNVKEARLVIDKFLEEKGEKDGKASKSG